MSAWSDVELIVENPDGLLYKVEFGCFASGSIDEPMLEVDGDVWVTAFDTDEASVLKNLASPEDRKLIEDRVEKELFRLEDAYAPEISQDLYERAVDHAHDTLEDR